MGRRHEAYRRGCAAITYFTHLPEEPWHFIKISDGARPGAGLSPISSSASRRPPSSLTGVKGGGRGGRRSLSTMARSRSGPPASTFASSRFLHPTGARHVRLLVTSGPKVLAYGATHGVYTSANCAAWCVPCAGTRLLREV
ncbi:MAG: hypothetical protein R2838_06325 [Caldilineaceae bacterium]